MEKLNIRTKGNGNMKAQDLKNSILQLAIQGKLVPQNPNDESAEVLYVKIQSEKQKLIKEGKIKKDKPLPPITDDEIPFPIPSSWKWVRLGSIGDWGAGATPNRSNSRYYDGDIPWLKTGDLNDGVITDIPETISELAVKETSAKLKPIGSVLMAMYGATIGKLGILGINATTNQACCACIPMSGVYNKYLFYYLLSQRKNFIQQGAGGAQPNISREKIIPTLFPLPPLDEQKRIVAKIEELDPLVKQYDKAETELSNLNESFPEQLKKSILQYAIQGKLVSQDINDETADILYTKIQAEKQKLIKEGKIKKDKPLPPITDDEIPFPIPSTWKWVRLGDIGVSRIGLTYHPEDVSDKGIIVLRSSNIQNSKLSFADIVRVNVDVPNNLLVSKGDIIICARNGSKALVGKSAIITDTNEPMTFGAFMAIYKSLVNEYVKIYLNSPLFKNTLDAVNTVTINQITQKNLNNAIIPLPPLDEQKRIVAKVDELIRYCEKLIRVKNN